MSKRVLVNLNEPGEQPYWTFVDARLNLEQPAPPDPRTHPKPTFERDADKAFANPFGKGYGDGEAPWPFAHNRAYRDGRYRAGLRNAIKANWTASHWKYYADRQLRYVLECIGLDELDGVYGRRVFMNESNYSDMNINFPSVLLY